MNNKGNAFIMYMITLCLFAVNIALGIIGIGSVGFESFFIPFIIMMMTSIVYLVIGSSIKSNDFTTIAGYDKNIKYHMPTLKKMLQAIINLISFAGMLYLIIFTALRFIDLPNKSLISGLLCIAFVIDYIGSIIIVNYKYMEELHVDRDYIDTSKKSLTVIAIFVGLIFLCVCSMIFLMEYNNIENNSAESLKLVFILFIYLITAVSGLIYEQFFISKAIKNKSSYNISKYLYISIAICILLLIIMFILAFNF